MAKHLQFRHLLEYSLINVVTNGRTMGASTYTSVEEVMVDGMVCVAKKIHPILMYSNDEGVVRFIGRFARECTILSKLRHPNIVQFLGLYFPSVDDQIRAVGMEFSADITDVAPLPLLITECLPYTLDHMLQRYNIPIHVKVSFLLDITKGLLYLHNKEIYHRDLTARHVLVTSSMVAKIAGFGAARMITESSAGNQFDLALTTLPGNLLYMPPEADQERSGGMATYNNTIDIFSFGVIVLFTITQVFPCNLLPLIYPDPDRPGAVRGRTEVERREKYFKIAEGSLKTDEDQRLIKLSQHCLQNDPSSRPKAEVILEELTYLEKGQMNRRMNGSTEIWKKDKLQLVELLDEKQKELDETRHRINSQSQSYDQLKQDHDKLQRQLERSAAENSVLAETNRDLRQAIFLMEDEKTQCLEEMAQLQKGMHILQKEKAALIREKEQSTRAGRGPEYAARLQEAERQAQLSRRRAEEAEAEAREVKTQWIITRNEIELTNEELGRGGWGAVTVANFRGTKVAAKCFYQELHSDFYQRMFTREMNMAARLRHPNLIQFIGASVEGNVIILMELMTTSLRKELEKGPMNRQQITSISLDVARALNYLHLMQPHPIIHRDISSANVLLDPLPGNGWKVKVSDYGSVNMLTRLETVGPGNPVYAAPEANIPALQSPKMDIFSFGVLLVEMLTHQFPEVSSRQRLIASIDHAEYLDLIEECLSEEKDNRPSAQQLLARLNDIILL